MNRPNPRGGNPSGRSRRSLKLRAAKVFFQPTKARIPDTTSLERAADVLHLRMLREDAADTEIVIGRAMNALIESKELLARITAYEAKRHDET